MHAIRESAFRFRVKRGCSSNQQCNVKLLAVRKFTKFAVPYDYFANSP